MFWWIVNFFLFRWLFPGSQALSEIQESLEKEKEDWDRISKTVDTRQELFAQEIERQKISWKFMYDRAIRRQQLKK